MILFDSDVIIETSNVPGDSLRSLAGGSDVAVSAVSRVEVLGYHQIEAEDLAIIEALFAEAKLLPISDDVIERAVSLRQVRKIALGDSLIAATALVHGLPILTRNVRDFRRIEGLTLLDAPPG